MLLGVGQQHKTDKNKTWGQIDPEKQTNGKTAFGLGLGAVAMESRYLPPEIAEQDAEESQAREPLILKLLSRHSTHLDIGSGFHGG